MKIRNEERRFNCVKTLTHRGYTFAFASSPADPSENDTAFDEIYWCVLDPVLETDVDSTNLATDAVVDDGWTAFTPLKGATEKRVIGMSLLSQKVPGKNTKGVPNSSASLTQTNPFVVVSDGDFIYLFRTTSLDPAFQASSGEPFPAGLLVDRFVLQQEDTTLVHALETRYIRSENADVPASDKDSLGNQSMNGEPFLEPAFLIPLDVELMPAQEFSVVRVPLDNQQAVWHIFAPGGDLLLAFSIPSSLFVPFDVSQLSGFNIYVDGPKGYPLLVPSAKYQLVYADEPQTVDHISASLYFQQEPAHNDDGDAISMMTNAKVLVGLTGNSGLFSVVDLELGLNGRLAGSSTAMWMKNDQPVNTLQLNDIPFYGTALELNGRSDYIALPDSSANGRTFEVWIKPDADPQDDQCILELGFGEGDNKTAAGVCLMKDLRVGVFKIDGSTNYTFCPTVLDRIPPVPADVWTHIAFTVGSGYVRGYLNGWLIGELDVQAPSIGQANAGNVGCSQLAAGYYFKGSLSEIRIWSTTLQTRQLIKYRSIDVLKQQKDSGIKAVYQLDEGQGTSLVNKVNSNTQENAMCCGGRWVSGASASRVSMPLACNRDNGLLAIRGAVLPGVQMQGAAALLPSADGLIRMAYQRTDNHWGLLNYDTRTQRNQVILSWKGVYEPGVSAKLRFTALSSGTLFNLSGLRFVEDPEDNDRVTLEMYQNVLKTDKLGLYECWKALPKDIVSIIDILNGRMPDAEEEPDIAKNYDYENNVFRTLDQVQLTEDALPDRAYPHASLLFGVSGIFGSNSGPASVLPDDLSTDTIQYTRLTGSDPRWVLEPIRATVYQPLFSLDDSPSGKLQIEGDLTLEAWAYLQKDSTGRILYQGKDDTPYVFGLADNRLFAARNKDCDQVGVQSKDPVLTKDEGSWIHLAASYHASMGLHLHNEAYVKCGKLQRELGEAMTVEAWVCPDEASINSGDTVPVVSQWSDDDEQKKFKLALDAKGRPTFKVYDGRQKYITPTSGAAPLVAGRWAHLSGVYQAAATQNLLYFPEEHNSYATVLRNQGISSQMTIEMWIQPEGKSKDRSTLLSCGRADRSSSLFEAAIDTDGTLKLYYIINANGKHTYTSFATGVKIPLAKDKDDGMASRHLAIVLNWVEGEIDVYLNGIGQVLGGDFTKPDYDMTKDLPAYGWIIGSALKDLNNGELTGTQKHYVGGMREVRLWSVARTEKQIIDHLNTPVSTAEAGLLGYWKMNMAPVQTNSDQSEEDDSSLANFPSQPRITNAVNSIGAQVQGSAYYYATPVEAKLAIYVDDQSPVSTPFGKHDRPSRLLSSDAALLLGRKDTADSPILSAIVDDIRIWTTARLAGQIDHYKGRSIDHADERTDLAAYWSFDDGSGVEIKDGTGGNPGKVIGVRNIDDPEIDTPFWVPTPVTSYWTLYADGEELLLDPNVKQADVSHQGAWIGSSDGTNYLKGYLAELRIWEIERKKEELQQTINHPLRGDEEGLVAYWPCSDNQGSATAGSVGLSDRTEIPCDGCFIGSHVPQQVWPASPANSSDLPYPVPVGDDVQYVINLSNEIQTPEAKQVSLNAPPAITELDAGAGRVHIGIRSGSTTLLLDTDEEPEATELVYLGQIQTGARIVGYIEGAPPLPSENMGIEQSSNPDKYLGASSVSLAQGDEVSYSGVGKLSGGLLGDFDGTIGPEIKVEAKVDTPFSESDTADIGGSNLFHLKLGGEFNYRSVSTGKIVQNNNIQSTLVMAGAFEQNLYNIGNFRDDQMAVQPKRIYRPNNMGAAIVKSLVADFYAIRSKRTGATLGYLPVPDPKIPVDTNVIMFKINPAYIKNGTLDGYIGFDKDIHYEQMAPPEKGSYYKAQEAYATKDKINRQQAEYTNYYKSLRRTVPDIRKSKDDWLAEIANRSMVNTYVWTADGGLASEELSEGSGRREAIGFDFDVNLQMGYHHEASGAVGFMTLAGAAGSLDVLAGAKFQGVHSYSSGDTAIFTLDAKVDGEGFLGKLAIPIDDVPVDADAWGPRSRTDGEDEQFDPTTDSLTQSLVAGGVVTKIRVGYSPDKYTTQYSIYTDDAGQWYLEDIAGKFSVALDSAANKADFTPFVDLGQYPFNFQAAPCPGKVLGYRFMSFYLDPDKDNFEVLAKTEDPDSQIIDKDWLDNPNDPNAVALKDALTRSNEVWRVYHRVTYVNRVPPDGSSQQGKDINHVTVSNRTQRPDAISMTRNSLTIQLLLGAGTALASSLPEIRHAGYPPDITIIDENIGVVVDALCLPKRDAEKLFNQLHNYMAACIASDTARFFLKIQAEDCSSSVDVSLEDNHAETPDGINVGSLTSDSQLTYDGINIPRSGSYMLAFRVATNIRDMGITVKIDGEVAIDNATIPNTGDWTVYATMQQEVYIAAGQHCFTITTETGGWNFDWWSITEM